MTDPLAPYPARVDEQLEQILATQDAPEPLKSALHYSIFNGGKRIRPALVYMAAACFSDDLSAADPVAAAVEMIHAYSLVHDDLPAMDDDDLRRGKPTCHIAFDEATAILAGDALQALAFETIVKAPEPAPEIRLLLTQQLAEASGAEGMVAGQMIDLNGENTRLSADELEQMHLKKTGALIKASLLMGATLAGANQDAAEKLARFGHHLGLAFQVRDDLLDETGETHLMGKQQGSDSASDKTTFVSVFGLMGAEEELQKLQKACHEALAGLPQQADQLHALTDFVCERQY